MLEFIDTQTQYGRTLVSLESYVILLSVSPVGRANSQGVYLKEERTMPLFSAFPNSRKTRQAITF